MKRGILLLRALGMVVTAACATAGCAPAPATTAPAPATTTTTGGEPATSCVPHSVVLLRHAEKATTDPSDRDPSLSPAGAARAARIDTLLGKSAITRLVATEYKRTQQTLAPLAARVGKGIDTVSAAQGKELASELRDAPPGSLTVVSSHSNVIPQLVQDLGGGPLRDLPPDGYLAESDYSRVLLMTVGCSAVAPVVELSSD